MTNSPVESLESSLRFRPFFIAVMQDTTFFPDSTSQHDPVTIMVSIATLSLAGVVLVDERKNRKESTAESIAGEGKVYRRNKLSESG